MSVILQVQGMNCSNNVTIASPIVHTSWNPTRTRSKTSSKSSWSILNFLRDLTHKSILSLRDFTDNQPCRNLNQSQKMHELELTLSEGKNLFGTILKTIFFFFSKTDYFTLLPHFQTPKWWEVKIFKKCDNPY